MSGALQTGVSLEQAGIQTQLSAAQTGIQAQTRAGQTAAQVAANQENPLRPVVSGIAQGLGTVYSQQRAAQAVARGTQSATQALSSPSTI